MLSRPRHFIWSLLAFALLAVLLATTSIALLVLGAVPTPATLMFHMACGAPIVLICWGLASVRRKRPPVIPLLALATLSLLTVGTVLTLNWPLSEPDAGLAVGLLLLTTPALNALWAVHSEVRDSADQRAGAADEP